MPETYGLEAAVKSTLIGDSSHAILSRFLDANGDGTGAKNMNLLAPDTYYIKPGVDRNFIIDEIVVALNDNGPLDPLLFGAGAALGTGCLFRITSKPGASPATVVLDLLDGLTIKNNTNLSFMGNAELWSDAGQSSLIIRRNLREVATPITLYGERGEALEFVTQDDLSGLVGLYVQVIGRITLNSH